MEENSEKHYENRGIRLDGRRRASYLPAHRMLLSSHHGGIKRLGRGAGSTIAPTGKDSLHGEEEDQEKDKEEEHH